MAICPNCHQPVADGAQFCANCGTTLAQPQPQPQYQAPPQPQYQAPPQPQYQAPQYQAGPRPVLPVDYNGILAVIIGWFTFGIYTIVKLSQAVNNVNIVCGQRDGKKTMNPWIVFLLLFIPTLGIYPVVWYHTTCKRIGNELTARGIAMQFGAGDYWIWGVLLGGITLGLVFNNKLFNAVNAINADYNARG